MTEQEHEKEATWAYRAGVCLGALYRIKSEMPEDNPFRGQLLAILTEVENQGGWEQVD